MRVDNAYTAQYRFTTNMMMDTLYNHFAIDRCGGTISQCGGDLRQNVTDVYTRATPRYIDKTNNTSRCVKFQYKCRFTEHRRNIRATYLHSYRYTSGIFLVSDIFTILCAMIGCYVSIVQGALKTFIQLKGLNNNVILHSNNYPRILIIQYFYHLIWIQISSNLSQPVLLRCVLKDLLCVRMWEYMLLSSERLDDSYLEMHPL